MFRTPPAVPRDDDTQADLIPVACLTSEGFGHSPYTVTPKDAVDALAAQLGDAVVLDSVGRRCVTRATAQQLFSSRADAERRQREAHRRPRVELAEHAALYVHRPGVPADRIPDDVTPAAAMLQAAKDAEPRRQSVLEHALTNEGAIVYHPIAQDES
jgi:hypothetical protein